MLALCQSNWRSGGLYAGLYEENGATLLVGVWWEYGNILCCLEWLGRFKCLGTGSDVSLSFLCTLQRTDVRTNDNHERIDKDTSKLVARHFKLLNHFKQHNWQFAAFSYI